MRNYLLLILTFIFISCKHVELKKAHDNFDEMGVLIVSVRKPLKIYANPTDNFSIGKIKFNKVRFGEKKGMIEINTNMEEKLKPFRKGNSSSDAESAQLIDSGLGPGNVMLAFRVLNSTPEYFEVLVNDSTKEFGYIKKKGFKKFGLCKLGRLPEKSGSYFYI